MPRFHIERGDVARDAAEVVALFERNYPGSVDRESRYRHFYERCPAGRPVFWVAREDGSGRIIGMFSTIPAPSRVDGQLVQACIEGDFVVDAEYRGAFGPAIPLTRRVNAGLDASEALFAFGYPNESSGPIVSALSCVSVGQTDQYVKPIRVDLMLELAGRVPRQVRTPTRALDPVLRVVGRDDRHRLRRADGRHVETPASFDARFEPLWQEHRERHRITGERSVDLLNWKYGFAPERGDASFSLVAVVDADDVVRAYAVTSERERRMQVVDLVSRPSTHELDLLLGHLIGQARRRGMAGVAFRYLGPESLLTRRLRSFGFIRRTNGAGLSVRVCGSLPAGLDVTDRGAWYSVSGDADV